jgi:hypothetical protein
MKYPPFTDEQVQSLKTLLAEHGVRNDIHCMKFLRESSVMAGVFILNRDTRSDSDRVQEANLKLEEAYKALNALDDDERKILGLMYELVRSEGLDEYRAMPPIPPNMDWMIRAFTIALRARSKLSARMIMARDAAVLLEDLGLEVNQKAGGAYMEYLGVLCRATRLYPDPDTETLQDLARDGLAVKSVTCSS